MGINRSFIALYFLREPIFLATPQREVERNRKRGRRIEARVMVGNALICKVTPPCDPQILNFVKNA